MISKLLDAKRVQATIESGDEEVLPLGGFEKNHRPVRQPTDERRPPEKGKARRPKKEVPTMMVEGETTMEKNVEKKATPNQTTQPDPVTPPTSATPRANTNPTPEFKPCPLCGYNKSTEKKFVVCKGCNDKYADYAANVAREIIAGNKDVAALSKIEWVLSQLDLPRFEQELAATRAQRDGKSIREWAIKKAEADCNGKSIPREILNSMIAQHEKKRSEDLYFTVKRLNARLEAARKLKSELEIAEAAKKAAETAEVAAAPDP